MKKEDIAKNRVLSLSIRFSLEIIEYCQKLRSIQHYVIANQLLRSGTAIGANIMEAQNSESLSDFIHKFKIASKEAYETQYWLILCEKSTHFPSCDSVNAMIEELNRLITAIVKSSKEKRKQDEFTN